MTAILGATAKVSVTAKGEGLTYTWYGKDTGDSAFWKSSVTAASYSVTMTNARNGRKVYCVVKDKYGNSVKSNVVTLRKFGISKQPANVTAILGATAKVSVTAMGEGLTYTWYGKDTGDSAYWKSSVTTASYSVVMTNARNGRKVYCVVKDKYGNSVKSNVVTLRKFGISKQPVNASAPLNKAATVRVTAMGEGLTYTWYGKDTGDSAYWKSSVTTASYSVTMSDARNGRKLYCVVKDKYGNTEKSNVVTLQKFAITKQPVDASAPLNGKVSVSVGATGSNLKYTWYCKDPADSAYWKSGVTSSTYSVELTAARVGRMLYCVVSDGNGNSIRSDTATILWFRILKQPVNAYGYEGDEVSVSLDVSGAGLKYVWYYRNATDDDFKRTSVTTPTYTMIMDLSRSGRQVYCVVTDNGGHSLTSHVAAVSMLAGKDPYEDNERYIYDVYDLVNDARSQNGLVAYSVNEGLMEAAAIRAREITEVFDHVRPNGTSCFTVHCDAFGENIAYGYGTPESVMNAWLNSSGHRANILNNSFKTIGIGCVKYQGLYYWVQLFGYR